MNRVIVNELELVFVFNGQGIQFSNESKVAMLEAYDKIEDIGLNRHFKGLTPKQKFCLDIMKTVLGKHCTNPTKEIKRLGVSLNYWRKHYDKLTCGYSFSVSHKPLKTVKVTLDTKIEDTNNKIQQLLKEVEELKSNLSVLKQAKELMMEA